MRRLIFAAALSFFAMLAVAQNAPSTDTSALPIAAGKVELVEGDVRFLDENRQLRRPNVGDVLHKGDSIVTGEDGEVHVNMDDGGYIGVRPSTRLRIANFKAEGGPDDRFVIGLLKGSFRSITGWIGKMGGSHYRINSPTATIGVRGTDHEPLVIPAGGTGGEPGTYDRVNIGETRIQTPQGSVSVRPNQVGFMPRQGGGQPRVLDHVPEFFRATRNESRFQGMHERVQQQIEPLRQQRIQSVREHRQQASTQRKQPKANASQPSQRRGQLHNKGVGAHRK